MDNWYNDPDRNDPSRYHDIQQKLQKDCTGIEKVPPPWSRIRMINEKAVPVGYFTVKKNLWFPRATKRKENTSRRMVDVLAKNWTRNHMNTKQKL